MMFHKKDARLILVKWALKRTVDMFTMSWSVNVAFLVILNCFVLFFFCVFFFFFLGGAEFFIIIFLLAKSPSLIQL